MKNKIIIDLLTEGFSLRTLKSLKPNQINALHKRVVKENLNDKLEKVTQLNQAITATGEKLKDLETQMSSLEEQEDEDPQEIKIGSYQTKYFDMCPGATELYSNIDEKVEDMDLAERTAKLQDALFYLEKHILEDEETGTDEGYLLVAENLAEQIMEMAKMMGLEKEHSYIKGHVDVIRKSIMDDEDGEVSEIKNKKMKTPITTLGMFEEDQTSLDLDKMSGRDPYEKGKNLDMGPGTNDGFNDSDDGMGIFEKELKEKFRSKAQQGYFFAKCEEEGPDSEWCKMADEFAKDTKNWKKLPEKVKTESFKRKVRQIENKILSLLESENKITMSKKDFLRLLENTPSEQETPVTVPTKTPTKTPSKPKKDNPFKPKHKPKPKGKSEEKLPEFLKFDELNIKFTDE